MMDIREKSRVEVMNFAQGCIECFIDKSVQDPGKRRFYYEVFLRNEARPYLFDDLEIAKWFLNEFNLIKKQQAVIRWSTSQKV